MEVINVNKHYGHSIILKDINFALNKGEVVGLVGRNGIGKSTLMKILVQNNQPTSGNIISSDNVGYLIEEPKLFLSKTGLENLKYLSNLYGVDYNLERFGSLIHELDLTQSINKKVKTYSLGTKQKLALLLTLVTEPDILILDEPTNSLDIESSQIVLAVLKNLALHENVGILISSHKLEDIEEICERVLFLENGLLTFQKVGKDSHNCLFEIAFSSATDKVIFLTKQEFGDIVQELKKRRLKIFI